MIRANHIAVAVFAGLGLAACASGGLSTGSLFGGSATPEKAPETVNDTSSRTLQVASTSARARKCGYYFDPARLRASFLAAESAAGGADMAKVEQAYDSTYRRIAAAIAKDEDVCDQQGTREIKADLTRHLSGDFTPRIKYVPAAPASTASSNPPLDRERIFDPTGVRTPKSED